MEYGEYARYHSYTVLPIRSLVFQKNDRDEHWAKSCSVRSQQRVSSKSEQWQKSGSDWRLWFETDQMTRDLFKILILRERRDDSFQSRQDCHREDWVSWSKDRARSAKGKPSITSSNENREISVLCFRWPVDACNGDGFRAWPDCYNICIEKADLPMKILRETLIL